MKSILQSIIVICVIFLNTFNTVCNTADSLLLVIKKSTGKEKIDLLNTLGKHYFYVSGDSSLLYSQMALLLAEENNYMEGECQALKVISAAYNIVGNYDSSIYYANKALMIAKKLNDQKSQALSLNTIGTAYANAGNNEKALEYYYKSMHIDSLLNDREDIGSSYMNIGTVLVQINDYGGTIEMFLRALEIAKEFDDYRNLSNVYHNLGYVYYKISDYQKAINYFMQALEIIEKNNDRTGVAPACNNIGIIFKDWKNYDKAIEYYNRALEAAEKTGQKNEILLAHLNLGAVYGETEQYEQEIEQYNLIGTISKESIDDNILSVIYLNKGTSYFNLQRYDSAEIYFKRSISIREKMGDKEKIALAYYNFGELKFRQQKYDQAIRFLGMSIDMATDNRILANNYELLSQIYEVRNNTGKALECYKKSVALRDSVFNQEKHKQINELQIQYETEKKEQQIESLEKINETKARELTLTRLIFGLSISAVLILLLLGAVLFYNRQLRSKHKILATEQKLLRSQMNPHFIFNSLSAIQSYILKNKSLEAGSYLSRFAKLMRSILDNSSTEFITLDEEVATLENYLNLQKVRLENKLEYNIHVDDSLYEEEISVPPMLSQPFIENAIEHGILKKEGCSGKIDIQFIDRADRISIEVTDDGVGRSKSDENKDKKHKSRATEITTSRLALLNKVKGLEPNFEIIDLFDNNNKPEGTKVIITLPKYFL
ncbi:MAG: tetratricopeptide repeat protein [Bacteroidales bacterium]|nr:tetratricopeptide repeat protein [Bacteroidales bacterium]